MAMKRTATSELNSDNWDQEEEPEEHGVFKPVGQEELSKRVIKVARRRIQKNDEQKPLLSGLAGFVKTPSTVPEPKNAFSFLSNVNGSKAQSPPKTDGSVPPPNDNKISQQSSENQYLSNIKTLNECLIDWLNTCIKKNPSCIFTPIFRDYEKHLESLKSSSDKTEESKNSEVVSSFKFNSASNTNSSSGANSPSLKTGTSPLHTDKTNIFSQAPTSTTSNWLSSNQISKSNIFSNLSSNSSEKPANPVFSFNTSDKSASIFNSNSTVKSEPSIFNSNASDKPQTSLFSSKDGDKPPIPMFNFSSKPPTSTTAESTDSTEKKDEDEDAPPVNDFKPVTEDDSVYSQRVKVFFKTDKQYTDHGVGTLFIKEIKDSEDKKIYQAIVRADTSLGNVLFNIRLSADIPTKRVGKNNVMVACIPLPDMKAPIPVLLRVKTEEDADKLLDEINKYK